MSTESSSPTGDTGDNTVTQNDPSPSAQAGRRRLLRGGLAAAPVILTVASRPVMAASAMCTAGSMHGSANMSNQLKMSSCSGYTPDYWANPSSYSQWSPFVPLDPVTRATTATTATTATMFDTLFGPTSSYTTGKTLLEVLSSTDINDAATVACYCSAAFLNAAKGLTPDTVLSTTTAKDVWQSFVTRGYYEPTAGVRWYAHSSEPPSGGGGIVEWLQSTMPN